MPAAIPNGGGGSDPTTSQAAAYSQAKAKPQGDQTPQEQEAIQAYEAAVSAIGDGRQDSGGTGGRQAAVALEVGRLLGDLERDRVAAVNQHAEKAAGGTLAARHAQSEMHGADTRTIGELAWLVFELRERLNDSPY